MAENIDVQIGRLDERVKALDRKVDMGNTQVLAELRDLKENLMTTQQDHELRIRRLEVWGAMAYGGLILLQVLVTIYLKFKL